MKLGFPLLFVALGVLQIAHAQDTYRTYRNARFGTTVRYPANLVDPQPESPSGDGRKFLSPDKRIELTTYGFNNTRNRSASGEMRRAIGDWKRDGARLTYYKAGRNWFVLSGYLGSDIFYEKTLLQRGVFHTLIWQYPKTEKKRLDASVSRSAATFSAGNRIGRQAENAVLSERVTRRAPRISQLPNSLQTPIPAAQSTTVRVFQNRPGRAPRGTSGY